MTTRAILKRLRVARPPARRCQPAQPAGAGAAAAPANLACAPGGGPAPCIEEVFVTAQKRVQSAQDVPISITTLTEEDIGNLGLRTAADVQYQTPGLIVSYSSTNAIPNFVLRGVGP